MLPRRDVILANKMRLRYKGPMALPLLAKDERAYQWKHPRLHVIISIKGEVPHVSIAHPDRSAPEFREAALVALAFFPELELFARVGVGKENVIHLMPEETLKQLERVVEQLPEYTEAAKAVTDMVDPANRPFNHPAKRGEVA